MKKDCTIAVHVDSKTDTNNVRIEPVPHKLRAPRMSPSAPVIGCRAAASSLRNGST